MLPQILATFASGIFAGAALYVTLVEHPARLSCGTQLAVTEWRPSYQRGTFLQAPLALLGGLSALWSWWSTGGLPWLIGGLLLLSVVPFTMVVILPTNNLLQSDALDPASVEADRLLRRWGALHAVRTLLSAAAFVLFLFALTHS